MAALTKEAVDWFFKSPEVTRFKVPIIIKGMCAMRLNGSTYKEIGDIHGMDAAKVREIILQIIKCYERYTKYGMYKGGDLNDNEINYIRLRYKDTAVEDIARRLRRSVGMIERQISQMMADGIIGNFNRTLNPNPITNTTRMLICRYYKDNLRKGMTEAAAKYNIASELGRSAETVGEILAECIANGTYEMYNQYGEY